jgi:hypothetical protein
MNRAAKRATAIVVAVHLLMNIGHGVAHRELHIGLSLSGSVFVIAVVLILPLVAMARLVFDVAIPPVRSVSPLSSHQPRSRALAGGESFGDRVHLYGVWIAHHGGDWNLRRHSFPMGCQTEREGYRRKHSIP